MFKNFHEQRYECFNSADVWEGISQLASKEREGEELDEICKNCAYRWIEQILAKQCEHFRTAGPRGPEEVESAPGPLQMRRGALSNPAIEP